MPIIGMKSTTASVGIAGGSQLMITAVVAVALTKLNNNCFNIHVIYESYTSH